MARGGQPQVLLFREALSLTMTNSSATETQFQLRLKPLRRQTMFFTMKQEPISQAVFTPPPPTPPPPPSPWLSLGITHKLLVVSWFFLSSSSN